MTDLAIRRYKSGDEAAAYAVCLRTGDAGEDASAGYDDPDLMGHLYVGPYLRLAPRFAFVLAAPGTSSLASGLPSDVPGGVVSSVTGGVVVGYCVGTPDTLAFERECERSWWPPLRQRYAQRPARSSDARLVERIFRPFRSDPEVAREYPAHLHINLLPPAQGRGHGRAVMWRLLDELARAGARGVHLGVAGRNIGATAFYERLGFSTIRTHDDGGRLMARRLPADHGDSS